MAKLREFPGVIQCPQFLQQHIPALNRCGRGRVDKGKCLNIAQPEGLHAQDHFGEVRSLNFRLGVLLPPGKIFF